ncbi:GntR family transcriptional regulator [bacterium]|nr:GntR family transcriptional regulator [bacterium]
MVKIGSCNQLAVAERRGSVLLLDGGDGNRVPLPLAEAPSAAVGTVLRVFLYHGNREELAATTVMPPGEVGDFALLKVKEVTPIGGFLDWGLPKDLFVPFREQKQPMRAGRSYVVRIYLDEKSGRIAASSRLDRFLDKEPVRYQKNEAVDLLICGTTEIGYKAIVNNRHWGVLYKNETSGHLRQGARLSGYVKQVRKDGKIDLTTFRPDYTQIDDVSDRIMQLLALKGGFLEVGDDSSPELIRTAFGVSKKSFKKALGSLYRKKLIVIEERGIRLNRGRNES